MLKDEDYLKEAARSVELQAMAAPGSGIPVDPDVAEHMGAFASDENLGDIVEAEGDGK